jgi:hypothetical protein
MKPLLSIVVALALASAPTVCASEFIFGGGLIPDSGSIAFQGNVSTLAGPLTELTVNLAIVGAGTGGAYNGDLYLTLQHDSVFTVLLNRPGRRLGDSYGYSDSGFSITLDDSAAAAAPNVHNYRLTLSGNHDTPITGPLTSTWSSDGRNVDPNSVLDSTPITTSLADFVGVNPNGTWYLFAADASSGGYARLQSWTLDISTVPEPFPTPLLVLPFLALAAIALRPSFRRR